MAVRHPATGGRVIDSPALGVADLASAAGGSGQRAAPLPACDGQRGRPCCTYRLAFNGGLRRKLAGSQHPPDLRRVGSASPRDAPGIKKYGREPVVRWWQWS